MAGDPHLATVSADQRGQNLHRGGLAGAVGAEQGEDRSLRNVQIDAVEHNLVAERLSQPGSRDRRWGCSYAPSFPNFVISGVRQERRITMSPVTARARTLTVSSDCSGPSEVSRELCILPATEFTSSQAAVPSRMPTSRSPEAVSSATEPRMTSPSRTLPLAVLAMTAAC